MLNDIEQIQKVLADKKQVLIALPPNTDGDALGSALALKIALEKQRKQVDIVCGGFIIPKNLKFLPQIDSVKNALANLQKFIIKVDVSKNKIETLSYDIKDGWLSIYLTPKNGIVTKNDLRTAQTAFKYDIVITIGVTELDNLGDIFYNNTDLFYRVPVVNIDNRAVNEQFGQINLVQLTAASNSEIVYQIINTLGTELMDTNIATAILTGMIIKTKSFKAQNVSPATLNLASQLINVGGDREKIIQNLYRTKTIATLKLWGAALTHLQQDRRIGLVWTSLTREDFSRSGACEHDLDGIIDELLTNSPEANMILVLYEDSETTTSNKIHAVLSSEKNYDAKSLISDYRPEGNKKRAVVTVENKTMKEVEEEIIKNIQTKIPN